jgi:serine/threonine protein kinase/Tfp pilus assembly protein PilF
MIGQTIGPYEVLEKLGEGGMGVVYKARDTRLRRYVALKFLSGKDVTATTRTRFLREAQMASALNHPNIVTIYDIGHTDESSYIVMEYLEGRPVSKLIDRSSGMPAATVLDYASQLAEALAAAHAAGVVHRDLKPGNVIVSPGGRVKVLDFGLAKFDTAPDSEATQTISLTLQGAFVGTVAYVAPEQSMCQPSDHRADIFSFGIMLHEMITGSRPFAGKNTVMLLHEINYSAPKSIRESHPELPPSLEALVFKLLEKRPADRYQTMGEVLEALKAVRPDTENLAPSELPPASAADRSAARQAPAPASNPYSTSGEKTSIAVLPFRCISADKEDEYLAAGISSEIIRALSGVPGVRVASQLASFQFREEVPDLAKVAQTLRIRYALTGSMRRAGKRIRVIAELSDAIEGSQIWSRTFDRALEDIFAVQEEIANAIVGATGGELIRARAEHASTMPAESLDAWGLVRKAYHFVNFAYHSGAIHEAVELLRRAVALAPEYGAAHAFLGLYLSQRVVVSISRDPAKDRAESIEAVDRALQLAPGDPEVLENAALVLFNGGKPERATTAARRAVEVAPFNLVAWGYLGLCLGWCGTESEIAEAHGIFERLIKNTPDHPSLPYWLYFDAGIYTREGKWQEAAECARRSLELQPRFTIALAEYANALGCLGRFDEAREVMGRLAAINPNASFEAYMHELILTNRTPEQAHMHIKGLTAAGIFPA